MVSIATYDPGGEIDYFAMLTANVNPTKILLTDAVGWLKNDMPEIADFYGYVERKIVSFNNKFKFDYHICEKNNIGTTIINSLVHRYNVPVMPVVTSNNIVNEEKLREGKTYNKNDTIAWVNRFRAMGVIEFPKQNQLTPGLKLMLEQLDNFGAKKRGDKTVFEALSGHDDFVTCLDILVHFAKLKFLNLPELTHSNGFNGFANNLEPAETDRQKAERIVKKIMENKNTPYDKIDIRF